MLAGTLALRNHGQTTYAQVTGKSVLVGSGASHTHWYVYYQYKTGKTVYKSRDWVDEPEYDAAKIGSRYLITYLPESPGTTSKGVVTIKTVIVTTFITTALLGSVNLVLVYIVAAKEASVRNHVRLLRDGTETQAVVASKRTLGGWSWRSRASYYITCNFYVGTQAISNEFFVPVSLYNVVSPGASLSVLYLPDRPQVNALYRAISDVVIRP